MVLAWSDYEQRYLSACRAQYAQQGAADWSQDVEDLVLQIFQGLLEKELLRFEPEWLAAEAIELWSLTQAHAIEAMRVQVRTSTGGRTTCIEVLGEETPFLLNTLKLTLQRRQLQHLLIIDQPLGVSLGGRYRVALQIHVPVLTEQQRTVLQRELQDCVDVLMRIVGDFGRMREALVRESMHALRAVEEQENKDQQLEIYAFISWLLQENILMLGLWQQEKNSSGVMQTIPPLGWLGDPSLFAGYLDVCLTTEWVSFAQLPWLAPVNHDEFCDLIVLRRFDAHGALISQLALVGLYTSRMQQADPNTIPMLRDKLTRLRGLCRFHPFSADARNLERMLRFLPRTRLLMATAEELAPTLREMVLLRRPRRIKTLWWYAQPMSMLYLTLFVPKQEFHEHLVHDCLHTLEQQLPVVAIRQDALISNYLWNRLDFRIQIHTPMSLQAQQIIDLLDAVSSGWKNTLQGLLEQDDVLGSLLDRSVWLRLWDHTFQVEHTPADALQLCRLIHRVRHTLGYQTLMLQDDNSGEQRVFIVSTTSSVALSEIMPYLEQMGLWVYQELSRDLQLDGLIYLHELRARSPWKLENGQLAEANRMLTGTIRKELPSDRFNSLILHAGVRVEQVQWLRAMANYMVQVQWLTQADVLAPVLFEHGEALGLLIERFEWRFRSQADSPQDTVIEHDWKQRWQLCLNRVQKTQDDRMLRQIGQLIDAIVRRSSAQLQESDGLVAFKLDPALLPVLPRPKPWREIFVFGYEVEGIHLRFGPLARGGIRWSDRPHDYRTEVLGLVKAQQVKNSVIVPVGSKGGFVLRHGHETMGSDAWRQAGLRAYQQFMGALLSLTDNVQNGQVQPVNGRRYDQDDTYLVVAADKGTATFSDIANGISAEHKFWLGDAFASGGRHGYDHKALGITARGAFIALQRHLWFLGRSEEGFSCIGIGDMSGDVFGNGMLLAPSMRLLAAFNHEHIFIDPNPDVEQAYRERKRLFGLARSTWMDYDRSCLSEGGNIYARRDKWIEVSLQARIALDLPAGLMSPDDLIQTLLKAPVDVIWNGGIGTYIKSEQENHADVGDHANDALRINGAQLRARIFCEGGNLGMTQKGRIEFALNGGLCHTDFIDNSAGVDCSDREVNIKLALQKALDQSRISFEVRNHLLSSLQNEVAERVLYDNRQQAFVLAVAVAHQAARHAEYSDFIAFLEYEAGLDRQLESLPDPRSWQQRAAQKLWLTRPELAVLLAYAKNDLKQRLAVLELGADAECQHELLRAFTPTLRRDWHEDLLQHPLRHALVATELANDLVHKLGITCQQRLSQRTGSSLGDQVRAFIRVRALFGLDALWYGLQTHQQLTHEQLLHVADQVMRLSRLAVLWWCGAMDFRMTVAALTELQAVLPKNLEHPNWMDTLGDDPLYADLYRLQHGVLLLECGLLMQQTGAPADVVVDRYFSTEALLGLSSLRQRMMSRPVHNIWQAHANETWLEQWRKFQRDLTRRTISGQIAIAEPTLQRWQEQLLRIQEHDFQDASLYAVLTQRLQEMIYTDDAC